VIDEHPIIVSLFRRGLASLMHVVEEIRKQAKANISSLLHIFEVFCYVFQLRYKAKKGQETFLCTQQKSDLN
jgi:hypothetical protein